MALIISPQSVSQSQIRQDLLDFLDTATDADRWRDFFQSSTGLKIVELIAGLGAFCQFNTIAGRREGFQQFAVNRSSIIGQAEYQGYSSNRGRI